MDSDDRLTLLPPLTDEAKPPRPEELSVPLFAYFGPETVLPVASVIATVLGALAMFGRASLRLLLAPLMKVLRLGQGRVGEPTLKGPNVWRRPGTGVGAGASTPHQSRTESED